MIKLPPAFVDETMMSYIHPHDVVGINLIGQAVILGLTLSENCFVFLALDFILSCVCFPSLSPVAND